MKRALTLLLITLALILPALARDKAEDWIQVQSQHFVVATNSNEKQARRLADQFERMREMFATTFKLVNDPSSPIVILAVKDDKDFRALEPEAYLKKGSLQLGGLFLRAPDKDYILLRLDAGGEHPYEVIYHEYTHSLLAKDAEFLPLWLNEGLAEFFENTEIEDKQVKLGEFNQGNRIVLNQNKLIPLPALFTVDAKSPYYHEENKGSIFYAESWALTHMLQVGDFKEKTNRLGNYLNLLAKHVDPVTAATQAFGDLDKLQEQLDSYTRLRQYSYFRVNEKTEVDPASFKASPLSPGDSDAVRADFLAYNQRLADAKSLAEKAMQEDPKNALAHETMGFMEFRQGHLDEAKKWYAQAVQLDSQSYLAHYYFAAISMMHASNASDDDSQVENSLRASIKLNPKFAPSYDRLAAFLGMRRRDLEEAHIMGLSAIGLDPSNVGYRINLANVFTQMGQAQNAVLVLKGAAKVAKTPEDQQQVDNYLMHAQEYLAEQQKEQKMQAAMAEAQVSHQGVEVSVSEPRLTRRDEFVARGPHRFVSGVLKGVRCDMPEMDLTVESNGKSLALHSANMYKVNFTALDFKPAADLDPCKDLQDRAAKVEYEESANAGVTGRVVAIELRK